MKFMSRPRRVILSGIIASALCAGGFGGYGIAHHGTAFAFPCPDPANGYGTLSPDGGTVTISADCTTNSVAATLSGYPAGSTNLGVNIYRGLVGQGTLVAKSGGDPALAQVNGTVLCNNYYYAYAAYTYSGERNGANTNAIYIRC